MITGKMLFEFLRARSQTGSYMDVGGADDHKSVCLDGWFNLDAVAEDLNSSVYEWQPVGEGTPLLAFLETKREGEKGTNISMCRILSIGDEPEWIDKHGRTTVTHSTFLPPTHWRWPRKD